MPPPPSRIYDIARDVLDAVVAGYLADAVDLPARRFVSLGPPAWDCELVACWVERTFGHAGDVLAEDPDPIMAAVGHGLRAALLRIQIVRCYPTLSDAGDPPTPAVMEAATATLLEDAQRVSNILVAASKAGAIGGCNSVAMLDWVSVGPDGAMAASNHGVQVSTGG